MSEKKAYPKVWRRKKKAEPELPDTTVIDAPPEPKPKGKGKKGGR